MDTGEETARTAARRRAARALHRPVLGTALLTPIILAGVVGASAPSHNVPVVGSEVTPLAAVAPTPATTRAGSSVVAVSKAPTAFHIAAATVAAPPPAAVVNLPGTLRIPAMALQAYRNAEHMMAVAAPGCGVSWNLLAGIGRIESMHANGGATDARGTAVRPIYGPALDGTLPGNEIIVQSRSADRVIYARAMGPMQFLPGTWSRYASDGDGDGKADVQNLFDSTLAAARYLCSGGLNLRDQSQVMAAILRYNNSMAYARNVLSWAAGYATGVVPVNLPPLIGPVPPIGDAHLDNPEGLGPGLPRNATELPASDPLAVIPLANAPRTDVANQLPTTNLPGFAPGQKLGPLPGPAPAPLAAPPAAEPPPFWLPPWLQPPPPPQCMVFCLESQTAPPPPAAPGITLPVLPPAGPPGIALPVLPPAGPPGITLPILLPPGPPPPPAEPQPFFGPRGPAPGPAN